MTGKFQIFFRANFLSFGSKNTASFVQPDQAGVVALRTDLTLSGPTPGVTLKEWGVDAAPAGVTVDALTVTVTTGFTGDGSGAFRLSGWDFAGRRLVVAAGATCLLDNFEFASIGIDDTRLTFIQNFGVLGLERGRFRGHPTHGMSKAVVDEEGATRPYTNHVRYVEMGADRDKPATTTSYSWCYFGAQLNAPAGTVAWDSGTTYARGGFALDGDENIYFSKVNGNTGNALPTFNPQNGAEDANWKAFAPHGDNITIDRAVNVRARYCLFDNTGTPPEIVPDATAGLVKGVNNAIRIQRNNPVSQLFGTVVIDRCAIYRETGIGSWPLSFGDSNQPNMNGPISVTNCWLSGNTPSGQYIYPDPIVDVWSGNVDYTSGNPVNVTPRVKAAPVNTVAPAITGTAQPGQTLTGSLGTWTGQPIPSYARQWTRDAEPIPGATGATYVVQEGDVGATLAVIVTATNQIAAASQASAGVVVSDTTFATELTLDPFATGPGGAAPVFSGRREQNSGRVFVSGSGEAGAMIEGRMVRVSDGVAVSSWMEIATATGGSFEGWITGAPRGFAALKAQVRYRDASNAPTETSNTCFVGWVFSYWAQSEQRWMGDTNFDDASVTPVAATPGISVRVITLDRAPPDPVTTAELIVFDVTGNAPSGREPVWAFANAAAEMFDDGPIIFMGHQVSGSNDMQSVDDSNTTHRQWEDEVLIATAGQPHLVDQTRPVAIDAAMWGFSSAAAYTTEAAALGITGRIAFGLTPAGAAVTRDSTFNEFSPSFVFNLNHFWGDLYDWENGARLAFRPHPTLSVMNAQAAFEDHAVYGEYCIGFPTQLTQYWLTNGTRGGDGVWFDLGHPSTNQRGGSQNQARLVAASLAHATGVLDFGTVEWDWIEWPDHEDPEADYSYVYIGVDGQDITTIRREIAPATIGGAAIFGEGAAALRINDAPAQNATIVSRGGFDRVRLAKPGGADWTGEDVITWDLPRFGTEDLDYPLLTENQRRDTLSRYQDFPLVPTGLVSLPGVPIGPRPAAALFDNPLPVAEVPSLEVLGAGTVTENVSTAATIRTIVSDGRPIFIVVGVDSSTASTGLGFPTTATLGGVDILPATRDAQNGRSRVAAYYVPAPAVGSLDLVLGFTNTATRCLVEAFHVDLGGALGNTAEAAGAAQNGAVAITSGAASSLIVYAQVHTTSLASVSPGEVVVPQLAGGGSFPKFLNIVAVVANAAVNPGVVFVNTASGQLALVAAEIRKAA